MGSSRGAGRWPQPLPALDLVELRRLPADGPGFLTLVRRELVITYADGTKSQPFGYDEVQRSALDAVVLCAHYVDQGHHYVYLRSALRPPLSFREPGSWHADSQPAGLWELPAGLIEVNEVGLEGVFGCAARELEEELGFRATRSEFGLLGAPVLPAPALLAEQQFFLHVRVDPTARRAPTLDGSPLEHGGRVVALPVSEALRACQRGLFPDAKTELGLRRLSEWCERH